MCRYYATKHKPAYTRLCYRYRDMRGNHVPGQWQCGQYPQTSTQVKPSAPNYKEQYVPLRNASSLRRPEV